MRRDKGVDSCSLTPIAAPIQTNSSGSFDADAKVTKTFTDENNQRVACITKCRVHIEDIADFSRFGEHAISFSK